MNIRTYVARDAYSLVVVMLRSNVNEVKIQTAAIEIQGFSVYRSIETKH